jgi:phenylacetate-CoA ligase
MAGDPRGSELPHTAAAFEQAEKEMQGQAVGFLDVPPSALLFERVTSAMADVPFYRELYAGYGEPPDDESFGEWFSRLPTIDKRGIEAVGTERMLSPAADPRMLISKATSGSTGIPHVLLLHRTLADFRKWRFLRPYQHALSAPATRLVFIFPWPFVEHTPKQSRPLSRTGGADDEASPGPATDEPSAPRQQPVRAEPAREGEPALRRTRVAARPELSTGHEPAEPILNRPFTVNSELPPDQMYGQLAALAPRGLIGFASSLAALARWMIDEGRELPSIEQTWTTSELLSPVGAGDIRKAFGTDALNLYASNEFGFMAWQPEVGGPLAFESDRLLVETVARDGRSAAPGEDARLLVSDLLNDTMPLLRYEIGDVARAHENMDVGGPRSAVAITDLQGKEADLLSPPDGRSVTTFQVLRAIRGALPHAQYRLLALSPGAYVLQYVPGAGFSQDSAGDARKVLIDLLGPGVEVDLQPVSEIRREPSGKQRPIVNLENISESRRLVMSDRLGLFAARPELRRRLVTNVVFAALAAVIPGLRVEALDESQQLYADLGMDSLRFVQLLVELERRLRVDLDDEELMSIELVNVADLLDVVERISRPPAR